MRSELEAAINLQLNNMEEKMSKVFIEKEIEIHAPVSKVWAVLVKHQYTKQWINEFSEGNMVTMDWQLGSELAMTDDNSNVIMKGEITAFKPGELLQIEFKDSEYSEIIRLSTKDNATFLSAEAGPLKEAEFKEHSLA